LLTVCFSVASLAFAGPIVPAGLSPGDKYHLVFITRGVHDGASSDISAYNSFVQTEAAANPALTGTDVGITWSAIASTRTVNARDNALVSAPIYLLNGTKVADGFSDLWDSTTPAHSPLLSAPINVDQFGAVRPPPINGLTASGLGLSGMEQRSQTPV
jgi:hypothetical protein